METQDSPVSNNGRGLKPVSAKPRGRGLTDSPVSNNGRGLKQQYGIPSHFAIY